MSKERGIRYYVEALLRLGSQRAPARTVRMRGPVRTRGVSTGVPRPGEAEAQPEPPGAAKRRPVRTRGGSPAQGLSGADLEGMFDMAVEERLEMVPALLEHLDRGERGLLTLVDNPGDPNDQIRWELLKRIEGKCSSAAKNLRSALALNDPDELIRAEAVLQLAWQAHNCTGPTQTEMVVGIRATLAEAAKDSSAYVATEAANALKSLSPL